ncbi:alpha/beta hydrolase [Dyadobacter sp. LHD-138]|uniref:alpha/beta hydrolase n=1 Tax=Dyadobacter sp. LHD-138 TaxID=3071413 RepID=UPI0027E05690|nr:alpha/beta hydrolase [Dyadobacter sp. LHD-138]MDQ6480273.1 alpha/beta hydrolase [Dyadobacter sp. LHD-138]
MNSETRVSRIILFILFGAALLTLSGCAFTGSRAHKNITYAGDSGKIQDQQLNIFEPRRPKSPTDVLIFIHGGNWNSGKKSQYNLFGRNWTKKDIVAVIPDYPLSPTATYKEMAEYTARSVKWVKENIQHYSGDPDRIFISGHSAGGHLAALVAIDEQYFNKLGIENPVKGLILIDAAGLDMYGYLLEEKFPNDNTYLKTFTSGQKIWKEASPLYHLHNNMPPMTIFLGGKTYPSIAVSNDKFIKSLQEFAPGTPFQILKNKKHIPMITQFFNPWNKRYSQIHTFMENVSKKQKL